MVGPAEVVHGPVMIGLFFNILLYGIMIVQIYIYFTTYKKDRLWLKIFVSALFFVDTVNTVFNAIFIYDGVIKHFGEAAYLRKISPFMQMEPISTGVIEVMVQLFYAWRIWILTKNWFVVGLVVALTITGGLGCLITEIKGATIKDFSSTPYRTVVIIWLAGAVAADVIITAALAWYLVRLPRKNKTGFRGSDMAIDRIIRLTMQTGLLTSVVVVFDLVFFLADPTGIHFIFNVPLCKIYSNSLVSSLNSRGGWKFNEGPMPTRGRDISTFAAESGVAFQVYSESRSDGSKTQVEDSFSGHTPKTFDRSGSFSKNSHPEVFVQVESHQMLDISSSNAHASP